MERETESAVLAACARFGPHLCTDDGENDGTSTQQQSRSHHHTPGCRHWEEKATDLGKARQKQEFTHGLLQAADAHPKKSHHEEVRYQDERPGVEPRKK